MVHKFGMSEMEEGPEWFIEQIYLITGLVKNDQEGKKTEGRLIRGQFITRENFCRLARGVGAMLCVEPAKTC